MEMIKKTLLLFAVMVFMASTGAQAAGSIVLDGSTTVGPLAKSFAAYFTKKYGVRITVSESGSGNGAKSLINQSCDVATMSRLMKPQEIVAAKSKGVEPVIHVVALDGLAIIIHPANPVRNLTKKQLNGIYTGKYTNWNQVGGPNARIVVIQRESNSGTEESFKELVVGKGILITRGAETQASNGAMKNRVSLTQGAIGFIGLGFVDASVKVISVDGVLPTVQNVKNKSYPVSRSLYMYTNGTATGELKKFIDLPKTSDGKRMVSELGFVNAY